MPASPDVSPQIAPARDAAPTASPDALTVDAALSTLEREIPVVSS